jgi:putative ABC transport system permease protein
MSGDRRNAWARLGRWLAPLADLSADLRHGARVLRGSRAFTASAVLTLALATGATTAIFSLVDGVLLQPLRFAGPDRLIQLYARVWRDGSAGAADPMTGRLGSFELDAIRARARSFDGVAGWALTTTHHTGPVGSVRLTSVAAEPGFFRILGVAPLIGRTFDAEDPPDVVVIGAGLWRRRFGADRSLPGRSIVLDGRMVTVLGVMPDGFRFPYGAASTLPGARPEAAIDLWRPIEPVRAPDGSFRRGRVDVLARLRPGVAVDAAARELAAIAGRLAVERPDLTAGLRLRAVPLLDTVVTPVRRSLWTLFVAVALVLAAASANVAALQLTRMRVRHREIVTRTALGASRGRLVRQLLAESLLLAGAGGALGLLIGSAGARLLATNVATRIPRAHEVAFDVRAFAFLFVACGAAALAAGIGPALTAARVELAASLRSAGGHATAGKADRRVRGGLVVAEVALAFLLAAGAALLMREMERLRSRDAGITTAGVVTLHLTPRATAADYHAIAERVARLPGVNGAGFTQLLPLQNWGWEATFAIDGRPSDAPRTAGLRYVTPGYFDALGIRMVRGRGFAETDHADAPPVILVNEALERRYFGGEDAVGRETDRGTIVGVVRDVRQVRLDRPAEPELYYPVAQNVTMASDIGMTLVVRTAGGVLAIEAVRDVVHAVNPLLAISDVRTMDEVLGDALWQIDLYRRIIGLFAALVLVLAAVGLYGVIAHTAVTRTREFAIRLALGSPPLRLARFVLAHSMLLAGAGLGAGALAALAITPALRAVAAELRAEPVVFAGIGALVLAIAGAASVPALVRAVRVDAAHALRQD